MVVAFVIITYLDEQTSSMALAMTHFPESFMYTISIIVYHTTHSMRSLAGNVQNSSISSRIVLTIQYGHIDYCLAGFFLFLLRFEDFLEVKVGDNLAKMLPKGAGGGGGFA